MMKRISLACLAVLMLLGAHVGRYAMSAEAAPGSPATPRVALKGFDPIQLLAGSEVPGNKDIYFDHNKFRYLFTSQKNRTQFSKDPGRYGIQGDGSCPFDPKYQVDPNIFMLYKGRIYAFASIGCVVPFGKNPEKYLAKWPGHPDRQKKGKPS